jgi:hypothetical protein
MHDIFGITAVVQDLVCSIVHQITILPVYQLELGFIFIGTDGCEIN